MNGFKNFIVPAVGLLLVGCASPQEVIDVNSVRGGVTPTGGTAFTKALAAEYREYAIYEADKEYEWDHASIFARKSLASAKGDVVQPEKIEDWKLAAARVQVLSDARKRLVSLLDAGARDRVPEHAAKAQAMFDCWIEEDAEGDMATSTCMDTFNKTIPLLEGGARIVKTFVVYFDFNKADITPAAVKILDQVAKEQGAIKPTEIYVAGHTDTMGTSEFNKNLSVKRAKAVGAQLAKRNVSSKILDVKSFGELKLAVPTPDNTKEQGNRRVEIHFEK